MGRSCLSNLQSIFGGAARRLAQGYKVEVCCSNFSGSFKKVNRKLQLQKLSVWRLGRVSVVRNVGNTRYSLTNATAGVLQGPMVNLTPLLLYKNDFLRAIGSQFHVGRRQRYWEVPVVRPGVVVP